MATHGSGGAGASGDRPGGSGDRPGGFGPVEEHLVHDVVDHERGWQEPVDIDGRVPRRRHGREVPRETLAARFERRRQEGPGGGPPGR